MKALLTALLIAAPLFANAYTETTWTVSDPATPVYVTESNPYQYTFNLLDQGFVPGTDLVTSYDLSIHLFDDHNDTVWFFPVPNVAVLTQPGLIGDDGSIFYQSADLGGFSYTGRASLNSDGQLAVTVSSLFGSFYVDSSTLTATGVQNSNSAAVPEPSSIALLAAGLIGIVVMRRAARNS
jgi:hypothetical protein